MRPRKRSGGDRQPDELIPGRLYEGQWHRRVLNVMRGCEFHLDAHKGLCPSQPTGRVILLFQLGSNATFNLANRAKNLVERVLMKYTLTVQRVEADREQSKLIPRCQPARPPIDRTLDYVPVMMRPHRRKGQARL